MIRVFTISDEFPNTLFIKARFNNLIILICINKVSKIKKRARPNLALFYLIAFEKHAGYS